MSTFVLYLFTFSIVMFRVGLGRKPLYLFLLLIQ